MNDCPRTNNLCEGWINKFYHLVGYQHPSIWKLIRTIQKEEAVVSAVIARDTVGEPPRKKTKQEYVDLEQRLKNLCKDYTEGRKNLDQVLRGLASEWASRLTMGPVLQRPPRVAAEYARGCPVQQATGVLFCCITDTNILGRRPCAMLTCWCLLRHLKGFDHKGSQWRKVRRHAEDKKYAEQQDRHSYIEEWKQHNVKEGRWSPQPPAVACTSSTSQATQDCTSPSTYWHPKPRPALPLPSSFPSPEKVPSLNVFMNSTQLCNLFINMICGKCKKKVEPELWTLLKSFGPAIHVTSTFLGPRQGRLCWGCTNLSIIGPIYSSRCRADIGFIRFAETSRPAAGADTYPTQADIGPHSPCLLGTYPAPVQPPIRMPSTSRGTLNMPSTSRAAPNMPSTSRGTGVMPSIGRGSGNLHFRTSWSSPSSFKCTNLQQRPGLKTMECNGWITDGWTQREA
ncbi:hypothetical protein GWK47_033848 [Chionoecetes opilio]|uniref:Uncharacterized protein n=1 Tax=Chionoecetes opilio TaxID=41210 RepID=A0A8J5D056_CHIOP|nr:hypothetical protein GWK47_033848 [Chionoecetes opilio]